MVRIIGSAEIQQAVDPAVLVERVADALAAFSRGEATVPPVGLLHFEDPPGDVHIKYGHIAGGSTYVVKIASGFYENPSLGLATNDGAMLVYERRTGRLEAILLDDGYLTELRTAAAGAVAARCLAPSSPQRVGIVGAGVQGRFQLRLLGFGIDVGEVAVWSRSVDRVSQYVADMADEGFVVSPVTEIDEIVDTCDVIVTATPARDPIIHRVRPGTHVTALGSDNVGKRELATSVLAAADIVAVDSRDQALHHGECAYGEEAGLGRDTIVELGEIVAGEHPGRTSDGQTTIADLTGVAVEDIAAAELALESIGD